MKSVVKRILRRTLGVNQSPAEQLRSLYAQLGQAARLGERVMRCGRWRRIVHCLDAEAAPGVTETLLLTVRSLAKGTKILDYGCGQTKSSYYQSFSLDVHSCDTLPMDTKNFTLIDPSTPNLPYRDNEFDLVIASEVVEHVEAPFVIIQELLRISKGPVILTTPNPQNLYSRSLFKRTGFLHWFAPENFDYHLSPVFLWQIDLFAKRHGATITKVQGSHQVFGLPGDSLGYAESLIITLVKRSL